MWFNLASPWSKGKNTRTNYHISSVAVSWLSKDLDDRMEMKTERVETIGDTISLAVIQVWEPLDMSSWNQQNFKRPNSPAEKKDEVEERRVLLKIKSDTHQKGTTASQCWVSTTILSYSSRDSGGCVPQLLCAHLLPQLQLHIVQQQRSPMFFIVLQLVGILRQSYIIITGALQFTPNSQIVLVHLA